MKSLRGPTKTSLAKLRQQSVYVVTLCDAIILGGLTNEHNGVIRLPDALRILLARTKDAIKRLDGEQE